jgi:hypothetical protein
MRMEFARLVSLWKKAKTKERKEGDVCLSLLLFSMTWLLQLGRRLGVLRIDSYILLRFVVFG